MKLPVLVTQRLTLRPLVVDDAPAIYQMRSSDEVNQYIERKKMQSVRKAEDFIKMIQQGVADNGYQYWAISITGLQELTGTICLWNFSEDQAEVGYELLPHHQHKGIMQEALLRIIKYGFDELKLRQINAFTHSLNRPSRQLLERCSFDVDETAILKDKVTVAYKLANISMDQ